MKPKTLPFLLLCLFSGINAFAYDAEIDGIYYNFSGDNATVTYRSDGSYSGRVVIPESITYDGKTYSVTSIGTDAFLASYSLTSVIIPNTVTSIGMQAFQLCTGLTSITIPRSIASIGYHAFLGCNKIVSFRVEEGNPYYDSRNNCNAIIKTATNTLVLGCQKTVIPNDVTSIGVEAFYCCETLSSIDIPNSVTSIGVEAFSSCKGLTSVIIGNGVTTIGGSAFMYCDALTSIIVGDGNTKYDSRHDCNAIIETATNTLVIGCGGTIIPQSVTSIGKNAFGGCDNVTSITIPESVTCVDVAAFSGCRNLTSIKIEGGNSTYDSRNDCNAIIETATNTLVIGCKTTDIPESVTGIGEYAFSNCQGLSSIIIPEGITSIGSKAFYGCSNLTKVIVKMEEPLAIEENTLTNRKNATLMVPFGCKEVYAAADYWKEFKSITEMLDMAGIFYKLDKENKVAEVTYSQEGVKYTGDINIPSSITIRGETYSVTSIGVSAFGDCDSLTSVTIPESVIKIGSGAFRNCSSLVSIDIPNGVASIARRAFEGFVVV